MTQGRGLKTGRDAQVQRGGHGESTHCQRDGAEDMAALQADVPSLSNIPALGRVACTAGTSRVSGDMLGQSPWPPASQLACSTAEEPQVIFHCNV